MDYTRQYLSSPIFGRYLNRQGFVQQADEYDVMLPITWPIRSSIHIPYILYHIFFCALDRALDPFARVNCNVYLDETFSFPATAPTRCLQPALRQLHITSCGRPRLQSQYYVSVDSRSLFNVNFPDTSPSQKI